MKSTEGRQSPALPDEIGGHMLYHKEFTFDESGKPVFIKFFDPYLISDDAKKASMISGLEHEAVSYEHAKKYNFSHLPDVVHFEDNCLTVSAYLPSQGWHWEVPADRNIANTYAEDILSALNEISNIPPIDENMVFASAKLYASRGWGKIFNPSVSQLILDKIDADSHKLHNQSQEGAEKLAQIIKNKNTLLAQLAIDAYLEKPTQFGHFDARPSNIGWHEKNGVRIVDWSWGSNVSKGNDTTMFLIDAHKADFETRDLPSFNNNFSRNHAALFIGYWLARSVTPAKDPNVRFHQFASAATATNMLEI